jgi:hypothetical protein
MKRDVWWGGVNTRYASMESPDVAPPPRLNGLRGSNDESAPGHQRPPNLDPTTRAVPADGGGANVAHGAQDKARRCPTEPGDKDRDDVKKQAVAGATKKMPVKLTINGVYIPATEFAYDGCHKIYLINTLQERAKMVAFGYGEDEGDSAILPIAELPRIWDESCGLKFISAADLNTQYVAQFDPEPTITVEA